MMSEPYSSVRYHSLRGRSVLITGGAAGIGAEMVGAFAAQDARVVFLDVDRERGEPHARATGSRFVACDLLDLEALRAAVAQIEAEQGGIDVLINNAGLNIRKRTLEVTPDDFDAVVDTDLRGAFFVAQAVGAQMVAQGSGSIVNIASVGGAVALRTGAAYAAAKAGVLHLTRSLAVEWAPYNVRVNALGPWYFKTPMTEQLLSDPAYVADILARTPLGRVGEVEELVGPALFLASDAASYVTGQALMVDGGMSVYGF
jgi:NAD(P)-dependent dehydrogenase (short-subunit alcohol dehydrogenase family)